MTTSPKPDAQADKNVDQQSRYANWMILVVRDIQELPDRNSPEDWPEAMLVTTDELLDIISRHAPAESAPFTTRPDNVSEADWALFLQLKGCMKGPVPVEAAPSPERELLRLWLEVGRTIKGDIGVLREATEKVLSTPQQSAAPDAYAVRMETGNWVGIYNSRVIAENVCAAQPSSHDDKVVEVFLRPQPVAAAQEPVAQVDEDENDELYAFILDGANVTIGQKLYAAPVPTSAKEGWLALIEHCRVLHRALENTESPAVEKSLRSLDPSTKAAIAAALGAERGE